MSKLLLIDGHSILNRAFFGLPDLTNSAGEHTGAIYGFLNIMFRVIEAEKPTHITIAFDVKHPTFRHEMFAEYKGTRKPMVPELKEQVPRIQEMVKAMGITVVTLPGYEADDILGTLSRVGEAAGFDVTVLSGDRDLLQLATDKVKISIPKTKQTGTEIENYYASDVVEAYGVTPTQFIDVKALWGDTADNIPGVESIGEKTAKALIAQYGSIEECYAHVDELKPPRAAVKLKEQWDTAVLSKELATINVNSPVEYNINQAEIGNFYTEEAYLLCKRYEFKNFLPRFEGAADTVIKCEAEDKFVRIDDFGKVDEYFENLSLDVTYGAELVRSSKGEIHGLAISDGDATTYIDVAGFVTAGSLCDKLVAASKRGITFIMWDSKSQMHAIYDQLSKDGKDEVRRLGVKNAILPNLEDVSVAAYLLDPTKNAYTADDVASAYLDIMIPSGADLFGKTKFDDVLVDPTKVEALTTYACYQAYVAAACWKVVSEALISGGMMDIYRNIELPLVNTLFDMEIEGIAMDVAALKEYGDALGSRILELEQSIYEKAGEEFNINSPKQLGVILFEKMGIEGGKKTKTGYSTAAEVLEELAPDNPIINDILEYRQLAKLKSTYADGLAACVAEDGRVHSTFMQTVTATGRISSTEPNLQNIPIRMELGRQIRKVFYPKANSVFLDADYSQIELRVLAHMSKDENLINAFRAGQDIHRSTASLVFKTPFEEVTDLQRRRAKAVNFGIVYGISAFGLSRDIGVDRKEAQKYINDYFVAYPKMHDFLEGLKESGKNDGFVRTMYGRIRPIPELSSSNFMQRQFGERIAMNSPIQGTAADIIKIAMVKVHDRLFAEGLKSRLLLQVHDELLIEVDNSELDKVKLIMTEEMTKAADLLVDLEIDMHEGNTWYEAK